MMKVLLADDEVRILNHLRLAIPWAQLGLEVCAAVADGRSALDYALANPVDILIADIRMPVMDGLELCEHIRETNRDMQIILLTGYADFQYAHRAIELQVLDYCLKPIDAAALAEVLRRAVKKGFGRDSSHADALLDLIEEGNEPEVRQAFWDLGFHGDGVYVAGSVGGHGIDRQLGASLCHKVGKHQYLYFSAEPFRREEAARIIAFARGRCGIGMPQQLCPFASLGRAIDDTLVMSFQYFINGCPTLCEQLVEGTLTDELFAQLEEKKDQPARLKAWLHELSGANCSLLFNIRTALRFLNRAATSPALQNTGDDEAYLCGYKQLAADYLRFSDVLQDMSDAVHIELAPAPAPPSGTGCFLAILKFLNEHYMQDISLKKISEEFHLNSSYISQLIKSETGLTYTQYVTELRMNRAKELLRTTDLSLAEVSEAVGFNDYFYFIKKFKKEVGVTPGKYI